MSKKCKAYSESKLGLEPPDNRKAFYAGWDAALAAEQPKPEPVAWQERHLFPGMGKWTNWYEHERPRLAHHPLEEVHDCVRYQFRPLYTFPLDTEALRRENERLRAASEKLFRKWSNAAPYHQWEPEMFEMELALYPPKQENKT